MEDLVPIIIVLIGVIIKIVTALKKNKPEPDAEDGETFSWEEFVESAEKDPEIREMIDSDAELRMAVEQAKQQKIAQENAIRQAQAQAEQDAALLEQQRILAEMAARAQASNQLSMANEISAVYVHCEESSEPSEDDEPTVDWAGLIRSNRTEAVVINEILAPPAALR